MTVDRILVTDEARDLIQLTRDVADKVLAPIVDIHEKAETYPAGIFATLGDAGLLSLPYPLEWGGGAQPYEVYLQVLEEIAARWASIAVAVSVHSLACHPLFAFGTERQKQTWLPEMLGGRTIGAYSLSEPQAGSDAAALTCKANTADGGYRINGAKAWITHGGIADFYALFARTGGSSRGISCFLVSGNTSGLTFGKPEEKMGLHAVPTTSAHYDDAFIPADRLIGTEGQGLEIAFSTLDLLRSPFGRTLLAIRENERRARFLGIPVDRHIWLSWVISCVFVSLAGTLYALLNNFADPHDLRWDQSGDFVIMAVLGGMRAFWGPLIGAAIFVVLQDYLSSETANWMSFIGLFFVLVVLFFPRGVLGIIQRRAAP